MENGASPFGDANLGGGFLRTKQPSNRCSAVCYARVVVIATALGRTVRRKLSLFDTFRVRDQFEAVSVEQLAVLLVLSSMNG